MSDLIQSILDAISSVLTGIGAEPLYLIGVVAMVLGVAVFASEILLRRTLRFRPSLRWSHNGLTWSARQILVVAMTAALYAATLAITAGIQLIPGFVQARPANALIAVFAVLFGMPGVMGLAVGNIIGDVLSGTLTLGSVGGFFGIFMAGWVMHVLTRGRNPRGKARIAAFLVGTILSSLIAAFIISAWVATVQILPKEAVWVAVFPSVFFVVLYPQALFSLPLLRALYPPFERRGWVQTPESEDLKPHETEVVA